MDYLEYEEYLALGGKLNESEFLRYAFMAKAVIDKETFARVSKMKGIPKCIKMLMMELIGIYPNMSVEKEKLASESVGSYSKSYVQTSSVESEVNIQTLISSYLSNEFDDNKTPLLYRG